MGRVALAVVIVLTGCGDGSGEAIDAGEVVAIDAPSGPDAPTDGRTECFTPECAPSPTPDPTVCEAAVVLAPGTLASQASSSGGFGDCALSASGIGGPSLYYAVDVPAGRYARVLAVPTVPGQDALVRVLPVCDASTAEHSDRGGLTTEGRAGLCIPNPSPAAQRVIIAVSRYSGEFDCSPLAYDLTLALHTSMADCPDGGFDPP